MRKRVDRELALPSSSTLGGLGRRRALSRAEWFRMAGLVLSFGGVAMGQRPRLDPQGDYTYDLPSTEAAVRDVSLDDAGFAWSAEMPEGDTVFLEFRLAETTGEEPAVTAARGSASVRQVFEPKAAGRRFLDVSPLRAGDRVSLSGSGAKWQGGPARLFVYRNRPVAGRRVLVLAPHPDDAEIAAFGVYRQSNADIVTITAGDSGWQNFKALFPEEKEHYRIKGLLRAWDSITVPMIGGVPPERARNLGYYNGRMAEMQKSPAQVFPPFRTVLEDPAYYRKLNVDLSLRGRPFEGTWDALVGDIAWELGRVKPEVMSRRIRSSTRISNTSSRPSRWPRRWHAGRVTAKSTSIPTMRSWTRRGRGAIATR